MKAGIQSSWHGVCERLALGFGRDELAALLPALLDVDEVEEARA